MAQEAVHAQCQQCHKTMMAEQFQRQHPEALQQKQQQEHESQSIVQKMNMEVAKHLQMNCHETMMGEWIQREAAHAEAL
jgi:hypothetical protein